MYPEGTETSSLGVLCLVENILDRKCNAKHYALFLHVINYLLLTTLRTIKTANTG
jgi:hypothetical protein